MKRLLFYILPIVILFLSSCNEGQENSNSNQGGKNNLDSIKPTIDTLKEIDTTNVAEKGFSSVEATMEAAQVIIDSVLAKHPITNAKNADLPSDLAVTIFQHKDFGGSSQQLGWQQSCYRGENLKIGEYALSSLKVPFGLTATLSGNWECNGHKLGDYYPGDYKYVGDEINDKTRSVRIYNKSIFYTATRAHTNMANIHKVFDIPAGYTVQWQEETKNGDAKWTAKIENGKFYIDIIIDGEGTTWSASTWCGVSAWLVKL